jgi:FixJ family two-component response regulator
MERQPILVVDDEAIIRDTLEEALRESGYVVETAENANAALAKLEQRRFAVVLTDMHMPGGPSGLELLSEIRRRDASVMVVIITGFATLETSISALKRGAYDFIQKPFKIRDIEAILDRALEHGRVVRELGQYQKELEQRVLSRTQDLLDYHAEVLRLNEITLEVVGESEPAALLKPFLAFLRERCHPDAVGVWGRAGNGGWEPLAWEGDATPPTLASLPFPAQLADGMDWSEGPLPETHLLPLGAQNPDGALLLGFNHRSAFLPEERVFALWRRQLGAMLRARHKALAHTGGKG